MNYTQRPKSRRSSGYKAPKPEKPASEAEKSGEKDEKPARKKMNIFTKIRNAILPVKGDQPAEAVRKIIFDIAVVALIITGGSLLRDVTAIAIEEGKDEDRAQQYEQIIAGEIEISDEDREVAMNEKPEMLERFIPFYAQNKDIVGWVRVGNVISFPVVQSADNDYYLTHTFEGKVEKNGAVFADFRNRFENGELSGNTVLYGHNIFSADFGGSGMFAKLTRYYDGRLHGDYSDRLGFYKENPVISFDTLYEESQWKVFACVLFNTDDNYGEVYPYTQIQEFDSKEAFNSFVLDIMDRSVLWTDVDLTYGDNILTLSTCYYPYGDKVDTRCVVFARKVRDGESAEVDVEKAITNNNPLKFTYQYNAEGGSWQGRTWDTSKLLSY